MLPINSSTFCNWRIHSFSSLQLVNYYKQKQAHLFRAGSSVQLGLSRKAVPVKIAALLHVSSLKLLQPFGSSLPERVSCLCDQGRALACHFSLPSLSVSLPTPSSKYHGIVIVTPYSMALLTSQLHRQSTIWHVLRCLEVNFAFCHLSSISGCSMPSSRKWSQSCFCFQLRPQMICKRFTISYTNSEWTWPRGYPW